MSFSRARIIKWGLLFACPLVLLVMLEGVVWMRAFDGFPIDKTTPFQQQIPLSHGAQLLIQGTETCGGMDGECSTRARLQIEWASGGVETVASDFTFDLGADSFELRKGARSWELRCRGANWSRPFRRGVWTRAGS